jgi:acyl-CoA dehydrogenase
MPDQTFLTWPFFAGDHRVLAIKLEEWARDHLTDFEPGSDVPAACRGLVSALGVDGWLRYAVPAECGGEYDRIDVRSLCLIRETLARYHALADFSFAMQGLGSGPISLFGSRLLKSAYVTRTGKGELVAALALSEETAGSDVAAITTSARKDGAGYVIDGEKMWISNAGIADYYVVFARTGEGEGSRGLSAFVVDADEAGVSVTEPINVISPHPIGRVRFDGCRVDASRRVGEGGAGFKVAMATLDVFRPSVGAAALGFARKALDASVARVTSRSVFGALLSGYQLTQDKIADMAVEIDAAALLVYRAAWTKDNGAVRATREAAMAKMYATEAAQRVIDRAVQLFGGAGVVSGSVVEELYRDIRPLRIYEGTTEIQKLIIGRSTLEGA